MKKFFDKVRVPECQKMNKCDKRQNHSHCGTGFLKKKTHFNFTFYQDVLDPFAFISNIVLKCVVFKKLTDEARLPKFQKLNE